MDALIDDLRHMTASWEMSPSRVLFRSVVRLPLYPRLRVVIFYRTSVWCWHHQLRPLALWLQSRGIRAGGSEIHPAAVLGRGFAIIHTAGIVIGHQVVAGENLVLYQGVTLGDNGRGRPGQPQVGDNVRIGAGAKVLGPVTIGSGAWIGANAVVLADVPDGATVGGLWRESPTSETV